MSKVLKAFGTVVAVALGTLVGGPVGGAIAAGAFTAATAGMGLPKPPPAAGSITQVTLAVDPATPYVMGEGLIAGVERHRAGYGPTIDDVPNPYYATVHVYSGGGPVDSITPYVDQAVIDSWYDAYLYTDSQLGACPESAALAPHFSGMPGWDSTSKLSGLAAILWNLRFDRDGKRFASGIPQLGAYGRWVKVYDPRLDSTFPGGSGAHRLDDETTWEWSENPALHAGTYAYGRHQNGVRVLGVGMPAEAIDWACVAAWASTCEANGWALFGPVHEPGDRWANLKEISLAGGGTPIPSAGGLLTWIYHTPRVVLDTITEADLVDGRHGVTAMQPWRSRLNTIVPKYRSPDHNWEIVAADPVQHAGYLAEDGEEKRQEWPFNLVKSAQQATELGTYVLLDSREMNPISLVCHPRLRAYRPGDCLQLELPIFGLSTPAVILTRRFDIEGMRVELVLRTETDAKHAYALGVSGVAPPTPALGQTAQERDELAAAALLVPSGYTRLMISGSSTDPGAGIMTGKDAGASASIEIAAHNRVYSDKTVAVSGATVTGLTFNATYYVYYDDTDRAGGAVTYTATTDYAEAGMSDANPSRHNVGQVITPADGAGDTGGGGVFDWSVLAGVDWSGIV